MEPNREDPKVNSPWKLFSLGIEFFIIFIGFLLFGIYLDEKLSTTPWFIMVFSGLGFTFALIHIIRRSKE